MEAIQQSPSFIEQLTKSILTFAVMSADDEHDALFENRYRQEDPEQIDAPSDEEAELAAYLEAKAELAPNKASFKNDEVRAAWQFASFHS